MSSSSSEEEKDDEKEYSHIKLLKLLLKTIVFQRPTLQRQSVFHPKNGSTSFHKIKTIIHTIYFECKKHILGVKYVLGTLNSDEKKQFNILFSDNNRKPFDIILLNKGTQQKYAQHIETIHKELDNVLYFLHQVYQVLLTYAFLCVHLSVDNVKSLEQCIHRLDTLCSTHTVFGLSVSTILSQSLEISISQILLHYSDDIVSLCKYLFLKKLVINTYIDYMEDRTIYENMTKKLIEYISALLPKIHLDKYKSFQTIRHELYEQLFSCFTSYTLKTTSFTFLTFKQMFEYVLVQLMGEYKTYWYMIDDIYALVRGFLVIPKKIIYILQQESKTQKKLENYRTTFWNNHDPTKQFTQPNDSDTDLKTLIHEVKNAEDATHSVSKYYNSLHTKLFRKNDLLRDLEKKITKLGMKWVQQDIRKITPLRTMQYTPLQVFVVILRPFHITIHSELDHVEEEKILPLLYHFERINVLSQLFKYFYKDKIKQLHIQDTVTDNLPSDVKNFFRSKECVEKEKCLDQSQTITPVQLNELIHIEVEMHSSTVDHTKPSISTKLPHRNILYALYSNFRIQKPILDRHSIFTEDIYKHCIHTVEKNIDHVIEFFNGCQTNILNAFKVKVNDQPDVNKTRWVRLNDINMFKDINLDIPTDDTTPTDNKEKYELYKECQTIIEAHIQSILYLIYTIRKNVIHFLYSHYYTSVQSSVPALFMKWAEEVDEMLNKITVFNIPLQQCLLAPVVDTLHKILRHTENKDMFIRLLHTFVVKDVKHVQPSSSFISHIQTTVLDSFKTFIQIDENLNKMSEQLFVLVSEIINNHLRSFITFDTQKILHDHRNTICNFIAKFIATFKLIPSFFASLSQLVIEQLCNFIVSDNRLDQYIHHAETFRALSAVSRNTVECIYNECRSQRDFDKIIIDILKQKAHTFNAMVFHGLQDDGFQTHNDNQTNDSSTETELKNKESLTIEQLKKNYQQYWKTQNPERVSGVDTTNTTNQYVSLFEYAPLQMIAVLLSTYHIHFNVHGLSVHNHDTYLMPLLYHFQNLGFAPQIMDSDKRLCEHLFHWMSGNNESNESNDWYDTLKNNLENLTNYRRVCFDKGTQKDKKSGGSKTKNKYKYCKNTHNNQRRRRRCSISRRHQCTTRKSGHVSRQTKRLKIQI